MRRNRLTSAVTGMAILIAGVVAMPAAPSAQTADTTPPVQTPPRAPGGLEPSAPPPTAADPNAPVERELKLQQDRNTALAERMAMLERALGGDVCANPGAMDLLVRPQELQPQETPAPPGTDGIPPADGPAERSQDGAPPADGETETVALPQPLPPVTPASTRPLTRQQLVANLKQAAVLVLAPKGTGSGYFVAPDKVMTNQHVIASAADGLVYVIGHGTGRPMRAQVIARERGQGPGTSDYALLTVPEAKIATPMALTTAAVQLQDVIAAGYPALLLGADKSFVKLTQGDMTAMPELGFSGGEISAIQPQSAGLSTIAHTANISGGNSGGPLVDRCGRVVGTNTFINVSAQQGQNAGFAIASPDIIRFLRQQRVDVSVQRDACEE